MGAGYQTLHARECSGPRARARHLGWVRPPLRASTSIRVTYKPMTTATEGYKASVTTSWVQHRKTTQKELAHCGLFLGIQWGWERTATNRVACEPWSQRESSYKRHAVKHAYPSFWSRERLEESGLRADRRDERGDV